MEIGKELAVIPTTEPFPHEVWHIKSFIALIRM